QKDDSIYHRLLIDMGLLGERRPEQPVRGLLLFLSPEHDPKTEPWHSAIAIARDPELPIRRVYLIEVLKQLSQTQPEHPLLATFLPYLIEDPARLREQAPIAYGQIQQAPLSDTTRRHCLDVFQSWLMARFQDQTLEEILVMLGELTPLEQTPLEQTRAYREIVAKNQPIWREEGRKGEAQRMALRLLRRRLGTLSKAQQARVQALSVDQLEDLIEALLDFSATADLETWLTAQSIPQPRD
ncbi:MAG: DUF4351 domain-containing protein, partial [Lamprobacter sp.]|uniref:DUF4351 domain-containing protein n=1 Tax=Lamprobacter sp. TaxID=3100796 RepID=UPI002B262DC6